MLKKRKIIYTLISITLLLIIGNILLERYFINEIVIVNELSKNKIEEKFRFTLDEHGIIEDWIVESKPKKHTSDSIDYIYKIKFPVSVSIASFLKDVNSNFIDQPVVIEAVEDKNYSNSEIKIYSNNILKLNAKLIHNKKIRREFAEFAFVVKIDDQITDDNLEKLSQLYFSYVVAFIPSEFSAKIIDQLNCNYTVLLNDEIDDSRFGLDEDFTKQRLLYTIKEIIIAYGRKAAYLIDESSTLYNSKIYSLIKEEFEKRGIKLFPLSTITKLKAESEKQLYSLFQFYATSLKGKKRKTFFVAHNDFLLLTPLIERQIKMGDRVLPPEFK